MNNIRVQFNSSTPYSMEGVIDQDTSIKVSSGTSVSLELAPGVHTLRAAIPYQGNEVGVVQVEFEVKPEGQYTILYKFIAMQMRGVLTVKENLGEGQETEVAKSSGSMTRQGIGIQITWFAAFLLFLITILFFFFF